MHGMGGDLMKNDKIIICFTDPNTGKEIKTDCIKSDDVNIEKESCDRSIPKFENFSVTSSGTCDANVSNYLKVLRYLAQQKQTHTT